MNPSKKPLIGDNKTTQRQNGFFTPPRERPLLNSSCHGRETVITGIGVMVQNEKKNLPPLTTLNHGSNNWPHENMNKKNLTHNKC